MSDSEKKLFEETTINEADYTKKSKKKFKVKYSMTKSKY